jgi:formylglycine-generating enzyme required for sulfatase activity
LLKRSIPAFAIGVMLIAPSSSSAPGRVFHDCPGCPEMVVIPPGRFLMGSPSSDPHRRANGREEPQHPVTIGYTFAVGRFDVTRDEYARFARETQLRDPAGCNTHVPPQWLTIPNLSWHSTGFDQTGRDPVVCVSWTEAVAYATWLSQKTGRRYRLLSEAEYEYVARAGTTGQAFWGDDPTKACAYENGPDSALVETFPEQKAHRDDIIPCRDGYVFTAPVGHFKPNPFGLYDIMGNVFVWVQDCFSANYQGAPTDGSARVDKECASRMNRGGSWTSTPTGPRVAQRGTDDALTTRVVDLGFRLARDGP